MAIETTCSGCGKRLAVADEFAGRRARCPACGNTYTVPALSNSAVEATEIPSVTPIFDSAQPLPSLDSFSSNAGSANAQLGGNFWMKATNGQEYGPVDRATLDRWFVEGRIGAGYQIRSSEFGDWQPATAFQQGLPSGNAASQPYRPVAASSTNYAQWAKPDQSGLILGLGILSWFFCPICGIVAWVMGSRALKDIQLGLADPSNRGIVQAGYYLGMVHMIVVVCCLGLYGVMIVAMIATGAMN